MKRTEQLLLNKIGNNPNAASPTEIAVITQPMLEAIITSGPMKDLTLAFTLAITNMGRSILANDNCRLLKMIDKNIMSTIITKRPYVGFSVAFALSSVLPTDLLLISHIHRSNFNWSAMIKTNTLNQVIPDGPYAGKSVAFNLCRDIKIRLSYYQILCPEIARHIITLAKMIDENTMNIVIPHGADAGQSVAFYLSEQICASYGERNLTLPSMISADTLNAVIQHGNAAGLSLAFLLSKNIFGLQLLIKYHEAGRLISQDTLNMVNTGGDRAESLASSLSIYLHGRRLLAGYHIVGRSITTTANTALQAQELALFNNVIYPALVGSGDGRALLDNIQVSKTLLHLYSAKDVIRLGYRAQIKILPRELFAKLGEMLAPPLHNPIRVNRM